ncbi:MAG: CPBP family intramembrane metalloprotease [Acidobacteria bacterium]|nr:CPBP family intramembrane metalloprotease [Acidobacteriota bacterium]
MWTPAVAVLLVSSRTRKLVRRSFHMRGLRFVPLGIAVGWSQILLTKLFLVLAGRYRWDTEHFPLAADGNGVAGIHGLGTLLGPNAQSFAYLALNLLLSIALASIVNAVIGGLGEELGWRVFLQPFLEARKGPLLGTLVTVGSHSFAWVRQPTDRNALSARHSDRNAPKGAGSGGISHAVAGGRPPEARCPRSSGPTAGYNPFPGP